MRPDKIFSATEQTVKKNPANHSNKKSLDLDHRKNFEKHQSFVFVWQIPLKAQTAGSVIMGVSAAASLCSILTIYLGE